MEAIAAIVIRVVAVISSPARSPPRCRRGIEAMLAPPLAYYTDETWRMVLRFEG